MLDARESMLGSEEERYEDLRNRLRERTSKVTKLEVERRDHLRELERLKGVTAIARPDPLICSTAASMPHPGRATLLAEQGWHSIRPHARQWWRRRSTSSKGVPHSEHSSQTLSGTQ